jgi:glycosyltransferase involved in cell wall biosynthesis/2-polyprenyl-3-methyl-5-hydroxy-6-metoxy-1,4-benzoquinol methylase
MKLAFVVQRYGLEVNGGAELLCRQIAEHLSKYFTIEIITTCAIDYVTWKNEYPEGISSLNNLTVHRFPVDYPRDNQKFNQFSERIFQQPHSTDDEIQWMMLQGPYSTKLLKFIENNASQYNFFIFFTYLYCTTFFGLALVKDKAILVPTAHDEPPIYLTVFESLFLLPQALIFSTDEEKKFVNLKFKTESIPHDIIGIGIDVPDPIDPAAFERKYGLKNFIVYVGRIDESKGCKELFNYFIQFKHENPSSLKLVLLGKAVMEVPNHPDIIPLGFLSDQDKYNCIMASELLVMPSKFESLSIVLFEAWQCNRPVLVNGNCDVLKGQCIRSNGGLWYSCYEEFKKCLEILLTDDQMRQNLGIHGKRYVTENYSWEIIKRKYIDILRRIFESKNLSRPTPYPGRRLTTLTEVDDALHLSSEARKISENNFLEQLHSFWLDFPPVTGDPWSPEYHKHWQFVYEQLAKKSYEVKNEFFDFDVEYHTIHPYPFCTQDFRIVSRQLMGIGKVIEALALPPGSSILEMGAGMGNISLFLAQMGYKVTVLDINQKYGDLIYKRAKALNVNIDFACLSYEEAIKLNRNFDCVLFFESFHHAYDHLRLLDTIPPLLNPGGILALAGEPMNENSPYEWGLNPDGEALWQIRTHGWFELLFRESYLRSTLERKGFSVEKFELAGNPVGTIFVCHLI